VLVVLRTKENAAANATLSADDVIIEAAVLTSVLVIIAETEAASRRVNAELTTDTAVNATPFACAITNLTLSKLVSSGNAYETWHWNSTETTSTFAGATPEDVAVDFKISLTSNADRLVSESSALTWMFAAAVGATVGAVEGPAIGDAVGEDCKMP
jgi:hypothetical protein